jgi:hypothetical protein
LQKIDFAFFSLEQILNFYFAPNKGFAIFSFPFLAMAEAASIKGNNWYQ